MPSQSIARPIDRCNAGRSNHLAGTHNASTRRTQLCRFFLLGGHCRYGDRCTFSHEIPEGGLAEARKRTPCPYFQLGSCRFGASCQLRHDEPERNTLTCGECTDDDGTSSAGERGGTDDEEPLTCGVCFDDVVKSGKRFGLLSGCSHCFCVDCLRQWRQTKSPQGNSDEANEAHRACPTCRTNSAFVVPSAKFCVGEEKERAILLHKERLGKTPCKQFNGYLGSCRFGRDCVFAHVGMDGRDLKPRDLPKRELRRRSPGHANHPTNGGSVPVVRGGPRGVPGVCFGLVLIPVVPMAPVHSPLSSRDFW